MLWFTGRAVLRASGHVLDRGIAPIDSSGHELSDADRSDFLQRAGKKWLLLPRFSEHILRTEALTLLIDRCLRLNRDPDHDPVVKQALREMHTTLKIAKTHNNDRKNKRIAWGTSIYDIDNFGQGEEPEGVQLMKLAVKEIKALILSASGADGVSFFDMDSAFKNLSVGDDRPILKSKGEPSADALVVREKALAEKEKALAARELAAREKALAEKEEYLAAREAKVSGLGILQRLPSGHLVSILV